MAVSDIEQKRAAVSAAYGRVWAMKVSRMSDEQVIALYFKFKEAGKIK